ncbi:MAG: polyprenyl synthetase family protein [Corynebacterium glucuronolyticum]|nr:polyprenyl synthetase family protein [Corynebacterium glucuronolyticum]MDD7585618.1 polyprenyl synthetase family protein [Mycobacteriaceae bacterium]MDY5835366.1 polyprenyl synthetase family protein [Corynebacterium glucuronolyticum]
MNDTRPRLHRDTPLTGISFDEPELAATVSRDLQRVEELLRKELNRGEDFVNEKVIHLAAAGGKRFRPMFAVLASQLGSKASCDDVIKAATVVEMTHLATLYHDDVMDEADRRRGVESANARWGNSVAILAGDILLAHASRLMAALGTETVAHFAQTFGDLVTGQMRETVGPGDGDKIEHYLNVVHEKTGVLISSAGYLGALHGGCSPEITRALQQFGVYIGTIFQIVDDIIDIYSASEESGKTRGTDLREGVFTLPVLFALKEDSPAGEELRGLLTGPLTSDEDVARALTLIEQTSGREQALEVVQQFTDKAFAELTSLPDGPVRSALRSLTEYSISRVR